MAEAAFLIAFVAGLLVCVLTGLDILFALGFGVLLFSSYSLFREHTLRETLVMLKNGVLRVKTILILFALIGCLTGVWRTGGTIPFILYHAQGLIRPRVFALCTFLLSCGMSLLLGTAFGTASTVGVVLMALARTAGVPPAYVGGAVLAGAYFGDRCSPMSTSAQLVCALTRTDLYQNIRGMLKSALVPFLLACALYALLPASGADTLDAGVLSSFPTAFRLHWTTLLPPVLLLTLALLRVNVRWALLAGVLAGCAVCVFVQNTPPLELLLCLLRGCCVTGGDAPLAALVNGGGMRSMARVALVIVFSSSYAGIFAATGLIDSVKRFAVRMAERVSPFGAALSVSTLACVLCCNQTLAVMMTEQACHSLYGDSPAQDTPPTDAKAAGNPSMSPHRFAMALADTAIVLAPLVPWSIAGAAPLSTIDAPQESLLFAFFLPLVTLCSVAREALRALRARSARGAA